MTDAAQASSTTRLTSSGVARMLTVVVTLVATAAVFFLAAGTLDVGRGWIYYGGLLAYLVVSMAAMLLFFPGVIELVNERGKLHQDVKAWDKLFGIAYTALLLASPAVAGYDVGRLHSFESPRCVAWAALAVTILSNAFVHWAMIVNKHAETGVRIQNDRHHEVISSGPYRIVRHPFYISFIVTQLLYPLAIGSLYAFVPALAAVALVVWRTAREDEALRRELDGYEAFTKRTPYRLLPRVW
jgi:protein-S-isoprenylcysteine O-methyltransferase Ste14